MYGESRYFGNLFQEVRLMYGAFRYPWQLRDHKDQIQIVAYVCLNFSRVDLRSEIPYMVASSVSENDRE